MPREKEGFREQLAKLDEKFPGCECITIKEACNLLGRYRTTLLGEHSHEKELEPHMQFHWLDWPGGHVSKKEAHD